MVGLKFKRYLSLLVDMRAGEVRYWTSDSPAAVV